MPKSREHGRDAYKRRQKKLEKKQTQQLERQQNRIRIISIVIVGLAIVTAGFQIYRTSTEVRTRAEDWRLPKLNGNGYVELSQFAGKPMVMTFFSSDCASCEDTVRSLASAKTVMQNDTKNRNKLQFVAVNTWERNSSAAKKFVKENGLSSWTVAKDVGKTGKSLHDRFNSPDATTTVFYDSEGKQLQSLAIPLSASATKERLKSLYGIDVK